MALAYPMQRLQDRLTQQWVIVRGRKIDPKEHAWLMGPFGNIGDIGDVFIDQLAAKEGLTVTRNGRSAGLIASIDRLNLPNLERERLHDRVVDFYENTSNYDLAVSVKWNPFFRILGSLTNKLFSDRLNQLHIPTQNSAVPESISSEIITLAEAESDIVKYTFWFRKIESSGRVLYSGVYGTCELPSGKTCIKAVFPLPNGNATVLMVPTVGPAGELKLESAGKTFGDAGFYFLLNDSSGNIWSQFIRSFRDRLMIRAENDEILAEQTLTLFSFRVMVFNYRIRPKGQCS